MVDGKEVEVRPEIYDLGFPMLSIDYPQSRCEKQMNGSIENALLEKFVLEDCGAKTNWNMKNFIEDQVELRSEERRVGKECRL